MSNAHRMSGVIVVLMASAATCWSNLDSDIRPLRAGIAERIILRRFHSGPPASAAKEALNNDLRKARTVWLRNRKDPVANFHVAYLIYAGADKKLLPEWSPKSPDLDLVPPGKSVEYDVLRWLVRDALDETAQTAAKGETLLKRSPDDLVLVMRLTVIMTFGGNLDRKRAVALTEHWHGLDPESPEPYIFRGIAYELLDAKAGGPNAQKAIEAFETALRLAPKSAVGRSIAENSLKELRKLVEKRR